MGYLEDGVELGVVGAVSAAALKLTPVGMWGMGTAALVGGAVSFGRAYWWDDKDFNEALNTGIVTAGTTLVGGAVMGKVVPWFGRAASGASTGGKKALEDALTNARTNFNTAKLEFKAAKESLEEAKRLKLSKETIAERVADVAAARKAKAKPLVDLLAARAAARNPPPNNFLARAANSVTGAPSKLPYWTGGMLGAGGAILLSPTRGYAGSVPTKIVASPKDGSLREGMRPLWAPDDRKIANLIAEGKVSPDWVVPPTLAAYMAGKTVA